MILLPNRLVRESKTVVDSGFHALDSGFRIPGTGFRIPVVSGTWIPDCNRSWDSGFQCPGFTFLPKKKFPRFRNPDSVTWGDARYVSLDRWLTGSWFGF